jgi:hypothetical protein
LCSTKKYHIIIILFLAPAKVYLPSMPVDFQHAQ